MILILILYDISAHDCIIARHCFSPCDSSAGKEKNEKHFSATAVTALLLSMYQILFLVDIEFLLIQKALNFGTKYLKRSLDVCSLDYLVGFVPSAGIGRGIVPGLWFPDHL
jgi:hypothetical protein